MYNRLLLLYLQRGRFFCSTGRTECLLYCTVLYCTVFFVFVYQVGSVRFGSDLRPVLDLYHTRHTHHHGRRQIKNPQICHKTATQSRTKPTALCVSPRIGPFYHPLTHRGTQHFHAEHVQLLPLAVHRPHVDYALHAQERAHGRRGHSVLPRPGLGDDAVLPDALCQEGLPHGVVDLVRASV